MVDAHGNYQAFVWLRKAMIFVKSMTATLNIRITVFIIIAKVLIVHHSFYHGYRKKEQPNSSVVKDSRLSRLCRGVQLYPHGKQD